VHCNRLLAQVSSLFSAIEDKSLFRNRRDFSRDGALQPELLVTLLLYMVADANRRGYRHLLNGFWDEAHSLGLELPTDEPVSAPSFCDARPKITALLLRHMLRELAQDSIEGFGSSHRWLGRRVFAVDGTKLNLQRSPDLAREFGVPESSYCPQALVSVLLDVCTKTPVDLAISPFASSERGHLLAMLPSLAAGDVLVLDRGYPSHEVFQELAVNGIDFLVRVPASHTFAAVDGLRESPGDDYIYHFDPPEGSPESWTRLTLRVLRITIDGSTSYFVTSLRRKDATRAQISQLYHMRWQAEEFFKVMKGDYIGQGQFRSKSPAGIKQEIHALVLFLAIARVLMLTAAKSAGVDYASLSQKAAVLGLARYLTRLMLETRTERAVDHVQHLLRHALTAREKPRPGRRAPRISYRPRLRWGATGRCGG
jgi:Transposase DDE domain